MKPVMLDNQFEQDLCHMLGLNPDTVRRVSLVIEAGKSPQLEVQFATITPTGTDVKTRQYRVIPE